MLTLEQTKELYEFLQGKSKTVCTGVKKLYSWHHTEIIKFMKIKNYDINTLESHLPKLTAEQAFLIIRVLQKVYHMIPDTFEICDVCKKMYDSDEEGTIIDECHYCDDCMPIADEP